MKKKKNKNIIQFLCIGDLHGVKPNFHSNLEKIDAIICPGDICGDDIRPYYLKYYKLKEKYKKLKFEKICPKYKEKYLEFKSLRKGRKILKYLNSLNKPIFLVPGNWDQTNHRDGLDNINKKDNWNKIKKGLKNIHDIEFSKKTFKNITFIGHGSTSTPEPLEKKIKKNFENEEDYIQYSIRFKFFSKIFKKLNSLILKSKNPVILISHNTPYKTKLDKINNPKSPVHNKHYGSVITRNLIDKHQPLLCISGHIHEGFGKTKIKKTTCINTGFGSNVNTIIEIDLEKNKIIKIEFLGENKEN